MANFLSSFARGLGRGAEILGTLGTADLFRERMLNEQRQLGNILSMQSIPAFARPGGAEPDTLENIRNIQLEQLGKLGTPQALEILQGASLLGRDSLGETMGATGAIAKRLMQDDPTLSFSDALAQVQTGFRRGVQFRGGAAYPLEGYGEALGNIGGQESYGTKLGELGARMEREPAVARAVAEAEVLGGGKITPREQMSIDRDLARQSGAAALVLEKDGLNNINSVIDRLEGDADLWTTGFLGKVGSYLPGTPQLDFAKDLDTVLSDSALNKLVELKNSSDTGASGLGSVTERELELLQNSRAAVTQSQSPEQFKRNLIRYKELRNKTFERIRNVYEEKFGIIPAGLEDEEKPINTQAAAPRKQGLKTAFSSITEAEAANLPKGTLITINGRRAVVE